MLRLIYALRYTQAFFRSTTGKLLIVAVVWQLVLTLFGWILTQSQGPLGHTNHWDAGWYRHIIEYGYNLQGNPAAPVFYPLFPLLVEGLSVLSFGLFDLLGASLVINTMSLWLGLVALVKIVRNIAPSVPRTNLAVATFLSFPSAFFMHAFYSEALFIAVAFWAYAFALERKWWAVSILLAILTAARLPSLLFVALCGLEYLRAYSWNIKQALNKNILWFLLTPLGFVIYGLYLYIVRGDFLAMFSAYTATNDWTYHQFNLNIFATLYETVSFIATSLATSRPTYEAFINYGLPLASTIAILIGAFYILAKLKSHGLPLFIFSLLSVIMFTLNSNVVSVHRYALACVCLYVAVALLPRKRWITWSAIGFCAASFGVQLFIFAKFAQGMFAG